MTVLDYFVPKSEFNVYAYHEMK